MEYQDRLSGGLLHEFFDQVAELRQNQFFHREPDGVLGIECLR